jgi:hypothetical protein
LFIPIRPPDVFLYYTIFILLVSSRWLAKLDRARVYESGTERRAIGAESKEPRIRRICALLI